MSSHEYGPPQTGPAVPKTTQEESAAAPRGRTPSAEELHERNRRVAAARRPAGPAQDAHADVPPTPPPDVAR